MATTEAALVTGATSNIGRAIAEGLSADGFHVIVTARDQDDTSAVAGALPNEATGLAVDFAEAAAIDELFAMIDDRFDRLSVLVNNVARPARHTLLECDLETWERTMATNLRSYFLCSQAAARRMVERGGGNIVNISISRTAGRPNSVAYSASKGGVNFLTKCAAVELAPHGVRVNAVGSGLVGTPLGHRDGDYAHRSRETDRVPLGHIGEPEDVAGAVRYLVSEDADYVVGALLPVDGGKSIA